MAWINVTPAQLRDEQSDVMNTRITIRCAIHSWWATKSENRISLGSPARFIFNDSPGGRAMLPLPIPILFVWVSSKTKQVLEPFFP